MRDAFRPGTLGRRSVAKSNAGATRIEQWKPGVQTDRNRPRTPTAACRSRWAPSWGCSPSASSPGSCSAGLGVAGARSARRRPRPARPRRRRGRGCATTGRPGRFPFFGRFVHPGAGDGGPSTGMPGGSGPRAAHASRAGRWVPDDRHPDRQGPAVGRRDVAHGQERRRVLQDATPTTFHARRRREQRDRGVKPNDPPCSSWPPRTSGPAHADRVIDLTALPKLHGGMPLGAGSPGSPDSRAPPGSDPLAAGRALSILNVDGPIRPIWPKSIARSGPGWNDGRDVVGEEPCPRVCSCFASRRS